MAELGGVWGDTQTQVPVHWSQCYRYTDQINAVLYKGVE